MSSSFIDYNAPSLQGPRPNGPEDLPHGLLTPPPRVLEIVEREAQRFLREQNLRLEGEYRQKMVNNITLQYYFDYLGYEVAFRHTPEGPEVLAVGFDEILALTKDMPLEERLKIEEWQH